MNDHYKWYLFSLLMAFGTTFASATNTCDAIPLSLSNITNCVADVCYVSQYININLPAQRGSSACLSLISPDGTSTKFDFNITMDNSYCTKYIDYYYLTDDPVWYGKGFCGCPGGTTAVCPNCPIDIPSGDVNICSSTIHDHDYCLLNHLGKTGTVCSKLKGTLSDRILVMKTGLKLSKSGLINVTLNEDLYNFYFDDTKGYHNISKYDVDIRLVSNDVDLGFNPEFLVTDIGSLNTHFYYLDSTEVNGLGAYDPDKIGYIQTTLKDNKRVVNYNSVSLSSRMTQTIKDCKKNAISTNLKVIGQTQFLKSIPNRNAQALTPGAFIATCSSPNRFFNTIEIPETNSIGDDVFEDPNPYQMLEKGVILLGYSQLTPYFIGFNIYGGILAPNVEKPSYLPSNQNVQLTSNLNGSFNRTYVNSNWILIAEVKLYSPVYPDGYHLIAKVNPDNYDEIVCWTARFINKTLTLDYSDTKSYWQAVQWPEYNIVNVTCEDFIKPYHIVKARINTESFYTPNECLIPTKVYIPHQTGSYNLLVGINNLEVKFKQNNAKPIINKIVQNEQSLSVYAYSSTVSGSCYLHSNPPGIIPTTSIELIPKELEYTSVYSVANYKGKVKIGIRCYNYNFDKEISTNINNERYVPTDVKLDLDLAKNSFNPLNLFDLISDLFSGDIGINGILSLLFYSFVALIIIIIGLVIAIKVLKFLLSRFSIMKYRGINLNRSSVSPNKIDISKYQKYQSSFKSKRL